MPCGRAAAAQADVLGLDRACAEEGDRDPAAEDHSDLRGQRDAWLDPVLACASVSASNPPNANRFRTRMTMTRPD
ncbi:MAG: hypothetical protein HOE75_00815 [Chloroflexi bacterium]|nr:hypothetical protein [Chloroflexota bacterium]MBT4072220.1 hypothetical protein [Chloroflexota bacterium]MBT5319844.1 hypothetical protein [Chloroflexota bacterium]MBT6682798.1 hypothetical protein [Chloroflexota bacterium]